MADKTATAPKAPEASAPAKSAAQQAVDNAKAAVANNAAAPPKTARKSIDTWPAAFESGEKAEAEAKGRTEGPKRAFKVTVKTAIPAGEYFTVAHNDGGMGPLLKQKFGVEIDEVGKAARTAPVRGITPESLEKLKGDIKDLSPERKAELKKQAEELLKSLS